MVKRSRASACESQRTMEYIVLCCGSVTAAAFVQRQLDFHIVLHMGGLQGLKLHHVLN